MNNCHHRHLDPFVELRLQRGAQHLHALGPRATLELLVEVGHRIGGLPTIAGLLAEYENRLTPDRLRAVGGDRFPVRRLRAVPREIAP